MPTTPKSVKTEVRSKDQRKSTPATTSSTASPAIKWHGAKRGAKEAARDTNTQATSPASASEAQRREEAWAQKALVKQCTDLHQDAMEANISGDYSRAFARFMEAHELMPTHLPFVLSSANMALKLGEVEVAKDLYDTAKELDLTPEQKAMVQSKMVLVESELDLLREQRERDRADAAAEAAAEAVVGNAIGDVLAELEAEAAALAAFVDAAVAPAKAEWEAETAAVAAVEAAFAPAREDWEDDAVLAAVQGAFETADAEWAADVAAIAAAKVAAARWRRSTTGGEAAHSLGCDASSGSGVSPEERARAADRAATESPEEIIRAQSLVTAPSAHGSTAWPERGPRDEIDEAAAANAEADNAVASRIRQIEAAHASSHASPVRRTKASQATGTPLRPLPGTPSERLPTADKTAVVPRPIETANGLVRANQSDVIGTASAAATAVATAAAEAVTKCLLPLRRHDG